jgi:hypothetical protein
MNEELHSADYDALLRFTQHLVSEMADGGGRCSLTDGIGGRCKGADDAMRWEDGFADVICEQHAESARQRGALVVYPHRHDGSTRVTPPGEGRV